MSCVGRRVDKKDKKNSNNVKNVQCNLHMKNVAQDGSGPESSVVNASYSTSQINIDAADYY